MIDFEATDDDGRNYIGTEINPDYGVPVDVSDLRVNGRTDLREVLASDPERRYTSSGFIPIEKGEELPTERIHQNLEKSGHLPEPGFHLLEHEVEDAARSADASDLERDSESAAAQRTNVIGSCPSPPAEAPAPARGAGADGPSRGAPPPTR